MKDRRIIRASILASSRAKYYDRTLGDRGRGIYRRIYRNRGG